MKTCVGHHQRQCRRALIAAAGAPIRTSELMAWCWPRPRKFERWHWHMTARAAHRFGVNIKRGWWQANDELQRRIRGERYLTDSGVDHEKR
jgi:hypothetical protein